MLGQFWDPKYIPTSIEKYKYHKSGDLLINKAKRIISSVYITGNLTYEEETTSSNEAGLATVEESSVGKISSKRGTKGHWLEVYHDEFHYHTAIFFG